VDKKLFTAESLIGLKNPEKSFPVNSDVGVLKWRLQTTEESLIPLTSKCPGQFPCAHLHWELEIGLAYLVLSLPQQISFDKMTHFSEHFVYFNPSL
jgi:hypothetical protein